MSRPYRADQTASVKRCLLKCTSQTITVKLSLSNKADQTVPITLCRANCISQTPSISLHLHFVLFPDPFQCFGDIKLGSRSHLLNEITKTHDQDHVTHCPTGQVRAGQSQPRARGVGGTADSEFAPEICRDPSVADWSPAPTPRPDRWPESLRASWCG
ncbi:hypothetical protein PoB_004995600 [Plakobranchus ocellatus]|uniref:Uncharacterized protein n=1 Tax=Plakobranchus ocellatus TaxID=259542 RepID=A0AAV4BSL5_9GAST|nr:hypothetical protein PoB_004995600 [Plakobranchus ocellatus]